MQFKFQNKTIYYKTEGCGKAVVLLHGFLENQSMWDEIVLELSKTHQVIRLDFPGFGNSENLADGYSMENLAHLTHELIKELEVDKYSLIGHSMGAYVAVEICKLFPNEIEQLILFHSTAKSDSESKKKDRDRAIKAVNNKQSIYLKTAIPFLFPKQYQISYLKFIKKMIQEAEGLKDKGISDAIGAMKNRNDNSEVVKNLNCKKTYIAGRLDPLLKFSDLKEEAINNHANFIEIENAGHMSHWENPTAVIQAFKKIIA